ncbi:hypothetical protein GWK47_053246 [Chionoecetes opilio]|uniref:Uncharacterized protein n=1 Tax=Chionoecetes opilio TaxID=41210 RepID=A0A8J4Y788_CHIOP|nr:hypothetical protein GWK47_053246 [Chionoecetes opilio]
MSPGLTPRGLIFGIWRDPNDPKENIVPKIEKAHREYGSSKKGSHRRSEAQISKEKDFEVFSRHLFDGATGMPAHDDQTGRTKSSSSPKGAPGVGERRGGAFRLAAQETGQISSFGKKGRCFLPPNKKGLPLPHLWRSSVLAASSPTLQLLPSDEKIRTVGSESCEGGEGGHEKIVFHTGAPGSNQADRSFRDYVLRTRARSLGQKSKAKHQPSSIRPQRLKHRRPCLKVKRFLGGTPCGPW